MQNNAKKKKILAAKSSQFLNLSNANQHGFPSLSSFSNGKQIFLLHVRTGSPSNGGVNKDKARDDT